ncbi:bZIP protein [Raphanus sativus]|uniref:Basic leucine zipper 6 n=1 Tax=Raphanus sativus TaxID=3726 RepID=A0A6J0K4G1_RAPSA|nr:basic leucine zipper 6 [Raphanus sativus]KAJ4883492.1 bZIP protein [Raphanus sativus]
MSRPAQLPPRCPIPKKLSLNPFADTYYSSSSPVESYIAHHKPPTQDSTLEEQPAWLDELLRDKTDGMMLLTGGGGGGGPPPPLPLRRSASDSVVLLGDISADFAAGFNQSEDEESLTSEACGELESACVYGPNSPRAKNSSNFSDNPIASAFSDYGSQKARQNSDDALKGSNVPPVEENACGSMGVPNAKRNPGQRSRVRKLQYIAELERRVSMLQAVEADLSVRVASLVQTRATLSLENSQMKQQMAILKQDKLIREGEYQLLKKEAQRLNSRLRNIGSNNNNRLARSYSAGSSIGPRTASSHLDWNLLDLTKLNLN